MFSTGTGIAPFASLIRDPKAYKKFDEVILTHTCREVAELTYGQELVAAVKDDLLVGEVTQGLKPLLHNDRRRLPVPRTDCGFDDLGVAPISPEVERQKTGNRVKICISNSLNCGCFCESGVALRRSILDSVCDRPHP